MDLKGGSIIGFSRSRSAEAPFRGVNAGAGEPIGPEYFSASDTDIEDAVRLAASAFPAYRGLARARRAQFLQRIASNLEALGDSLVERVVAESALFPGRVRAERDRTCSQLRFFAGVVEEGSWVDARIDTAEPDRKPAPKPDVRSMLRPLGPVAVFCAGNFPLAFSVAGGDSVSALAAGNPVVVNAHFSHPGTAEYAGSAIRDAAEATRMPEGVFSLLFSSGQRVGQRLVAHPRIQAAAFTGSRSGGLALAEIAHTRAERIPFFAEMSSVNPVFLLPHAVEQDGARLAAGLHASITLGAGQFCTNPGILLAPRGPSGDGFSSALAGAIKADGPACMLNAGIAENYRRLASARSRDERIKTLAWADSGNLVSPALFEVGAATFLKAPELAEEVFGPSSILVRYSSTNELMAVAASMEGNLTATILAGPGDEAAAAELAAILETKAGRILFGGVPTGVEVCQAMVHGGPFPATSDGRSTSVGGRAIERFVRPVCWQDAAQDSLPEELRTGNPAGIWRMVNGERTRSA